MSFHASKRRLQRALLTTACLAALAGCGGDDDDAPPVTTRRPRGGALREELDRRVVRLLTDRGLDAELAECAVGELAGTVSDEELESAIAEIRNTGAAPSEVIEAAAAAGGPAAGHEGNRTPRPGETIAFFTHTRTPTRPRGDLRGSPRTRRLRRRR